MSGKTSITKEVIYKLCGVGAGVAIILSYKYFVPKTGTTSPVKMPAAPPKLMGLAAIQAAASLQASNVMVEHHGIVTSLLPDADWGGNQQRFMVELEDKSTLMITHNVDVAPRAPVVKGDRVDFRGRYEWNPTGAVIHWTHRDATGTTESGWLKLNGKVYQ